MTRNTGAPAITAVIGSGLSGAGAVQELLLQGKRVYLYDDSAEAAGAFAARPETAPFARSGMLHCVADIAAVPWAEAEEAVCSPGVPLTHPAPHKAVSAARAAGCRLICDIDIMYRNYPGKTHIAVTGTNGKSTVVSLIAHVLRGSGREAALAGNIGEAAAGARVSSEQACIVTECSSFQLDLIAEYRPSVAVWLNITPDHIDRHGDIAGYVAAKRRMFGFQKEADTACIAVDDPYSAETAAHLRALPGAPRVVTFTAAETPGADVAFGTDGIIRDRRSGAERTFPANSLNNGAAARQNAAAAFCAFTTAGGDAERFVALAENFVPLPHRMRPVARCGNVTFINDSKATNADAARAALQAYPGCAWLLGGVAKEGGIGALADLFSAVGRAYTFGECGGAFAETLEHAGVNVIRSATLEKAFAAVCSDLASEGAFAPEAPSRAVVLSPAAASFDQFAGFAARGDAFTLLAATAAERYNAQGNGKGAA